MGNNLKKGLKILIYFKNVIDEKKFPEYLHFIKERGVPCFFQKHLNKFLFCNQKVVF